MDIAKTIAKYRKAKNLTQQALGERLGVSNQAVSKWENGSSSPDISIIPELANVLGISLDQFFGISGKDRKHTKCHPDDFPEAAYDDLLQLFFKSIKMRFTNVGPSDEEQLEAIREGMKRGQYLGCLSNTQGAFFLSKSFAFADRNFKTLDCSKVFDSATPVIMLRILADENLLRVLKYEYELSFANSKSHGTVLIAEDIAAACGMPVETVREALERLVALHINQKIYQQKDEFEDGRCQYRVCFQGMMFVVAIFKLVHYMANESKHWAIIRDTQMISDYAF